MLATAWLLGIANPQSIKRLGHFLTADCKSAGTPNGGRAYPALRMGISGAKERAYPALRMGISGATETTSERGGEVLYIIASKIYFIDNVSPD